MSAAVTVARVAPSKPTIKTPPIPPNQTLYVTNLPSAKINKADLKTALYLLFSTYGPILDVIALKTAKMRGQAHIVFRDINAATQAMRSLDGFQFLGKELRIQYAKSKSDTIAKLDGTYKLPGSAVANVEMTETQQSIFNAPAPTSSTASTSHGLPARPPQATTPARINAPSPDTRGQKRPRDEEQEEEEDDSDEDVAMEEDSDDE
ncbi:RNA-binding domain-containing protein [Xylariaceae sp. AK1471]|nr:RNA-binding domain-containing protein [Xylariaceae sp. AK1471]